MCRGSSVLLRKVQVSSPGLCTAHLHRNNIASQQAMYLSGFKHTPYHTMMLKIAACLMPSVTLAHVGLAVLGTCILLNTRACLRNTPGPNVGLVHRKAGAAAEQRGIEFSMANRGGSTQQRRGVGRWHVGARPPRCGLRPRQGLLAVIVVRWFCVILSSVLAVGALASLG